MTKGEKTVGGLLDYGFERQGTARHWEYGRKFKCGSGYKVRCLFYMGKDMNRIISQAMVQMEVLLSALHNLRFG